MVVWMPVMWLRWNELERENAELKKMYAEISVENRAMKNLIEKSYNASRKMESCGIPGKGRADK